MTLPDGKHGGTGVDSVQRPWDGAGDWDGARKGKNVGAFLLAQLYGEISVLKFGELSPRPLLPPENKSF